MSAINLIHIFFAGPLLIAIGSGYFPLLSGYPIVALGAFIALYHAYRAYGRWPTMFPWINMFHALVVGPLLIVAGLPMEKPRAVGDALVGLGFAAIGYHAWRALGA